MLNLALRILLRNGWLTASLCFGLLTAVAVTTSIPLYTRGALQRVLIRDLVDYRDREDIYPGGFTISRRFSSARYSAEVFKELPKYEEHVRRSLEVDLSLPIEISTSRLDIKSLYILDADREFDFDLVRSTNLIALSDLPSHISIVAGDLPSEIARDDVFEVLVTEEAMFENDYLLGKTYEIFDVRLNRVCSVLIAGVFQVDPSSKGYWYANLADLDNAVFMDPKLFRSILSTQSVWLADARWYFGLDLSQLHTSEIGSLKRNMEKQMSSLDDLGASVSTPLIGIIDDYLEKQANIILLLLFIIVPVLVILVYFLIMLAGIIMESETNDIALLKSRGASSGRVITLYLIVFSIPTILALVAGPFAGVGIARLIGTSSGFLRFGNTEGFSTSLSFGVWLYGLAAVTLCFSTVLAPIIKSSKTTIVIHKTRQARIGRSWLWKGLIPAIALALIALYGLYSFGIRQQILTATSAKGGDLPLDPIYLVAASLFIFGVGMLVLRLLPLVVLSIFAIVRRITSASLYAAITRIGRSFTRERYAFLFLLLTVASGIFFASTARSTNLATSHKFLYANGTDVRLLFATSGSSERFLDFLKERRRLIEAYPALDEVQSSGVRYSRSVYDYERIAGVESATIVSRIPEAVLVTPSGRRLNVSILAIDPVSFGKTSWYRNDLNPYNLRSYLETLIKYPDHIFLSTGSFEGYQSSTKPFSVQVPGYNPFEAAIALPPSAGFSSIHSFQYISLLVLKSDLSNSLNRGGKFMKNKLRNLFFSQL